MSRFVLVVPHTMRHLYANLIVQYEQMRYFWYVQKKQWEQPRLRIPRRERDVHDEKAVYVLLIESGRVVAGYRRLKEDLPVRGFMSEVGIDLPGNASEFSRFVTGGLPHVRSLLPATRLIVETLEREAFAPYALLNADLEGVLNQEAPGLIVNLKPGYVIQKNGQPFILAAIKVERIEKPSTLEIYDLSEGDHAKALQSAA